MWNEESYRSEGPRNDAIRELNRSLELPDYVAGELDWTTGIMRVNTDVERWKEWRPAPLSNKPLLLTLLHEGQHALQIAAFYKLYVTSITLYGITRVLDETFPDVADLPERLDDVLPAENFEFVRSAMWDLTWRGDYDLSVLEIVEGVTHLTEMRQERHFETQDYLGYLARARVGPTYTRAFKRFYELSNGHPLSIWYFPPACHLALCSKTPQHSFRALAEALAKGAIDDQSGVADLRGVCVEEDPDFVGWAWEIRDKSPTLRHPMFDRLTTLMQKAAEQSDAFERYLLRPDKDETFNVPAMEQPTIFNPTPDPNAPGYREWMTLVFHWDGTPGSEQWHGAPSKEQKLRALRKLVKLATISRRYFADFGNPPPSVVRTQKPA